MRKRPQEKPTVRESLRTDGSLCVTFVNSANAQRRGFSDYQELLDWSVAAGALTAGWRSRLEAAARRRPGAAAGVARKAGTRRGRLRRILVAVAAGARPAGSDFGPFNAELSATLAARELQPGDGHCQWSWAGDSEDDLDRVLWPVLLDAAELLATVRIGKLRRCATEDCGLLFLAAGGGRPRKRCSPACGSRVASRKHYHRKIKPERKRMKEIVKGKQRAHLAGMDVSRASTGPRRRRRK